VKSLRVRPGSYPKWNFLKAVALPGNINQGQKGLPETSTRAYFGTFKSFEEKRFPK
jgi:hypothetical protein